MKKIEVILLGLTLLLGGFLRFYDISNNPPGLYIDEASLGYNSIRLLETGQDEHGSFYPLFLKAFGEYKMPIYIYMTAGWMALLGQNEIAVRITSALAGIFTIIILYFFIKQILEFDKGKISSFFKKSIPIISVFILCISPWHIHFSRGGFEANLAVFFHLLGSYLVLIYFKKRKVNYLIGGFLLYALTLYTYNSFRVISILTFLSLTTYLFIVDKKNRKDFIKAAVTYGISSIPLVLFSLTAGGQIRFEQTSTFVEYTAETIMQKLLIYPMVFVKNFLSFFSFDFLFWYGDGNGRHQIPGFGLFYRWQLPFLLIGIGYLLKQKKSMLKHIAFALLMLAPIPASITRPSPHSLRALLLVIPLSILVSVGIVVALQILKRWRKVIVLVVSVVIMYEFIIYMHFYYAHYPNVNARDWGSGYKETVQKASKYMKTYDYLIIDGNVGDNSIFTSIYFKFYDDSLKPVFVDSHWKKPKEWGDRSVLYIRPYYVPNKDPKIFDKVYLPGPNKDIFVEFWKL